MIQFLEIFSAILVVTSSENLDVRPSLSFVALPWEPPRISAYESRSKDHRTKNHRTKDHPHKRPPSWFFYGDILSHLTVYSFIRERVKNDKNDVVCLCCCSLL